MKPNPMPMPQTLTKNQEAVLSSLRKAGRPLSAYDILDQLRHLGLKAPPQIYRALAALIEHGLVHKVESLNAFVACTTLSGKPHSHGDLVFLICRTCGAVTESVSKRLIEACYGEGQAHKFKTEQVRIEIHGLCATCAQGEAS